ncbi:unnamed protein product [Orchesella dallaii]|uniref:Uncharacterized protein n=1 Tax=Orchesella dallaii TaxID=48710 RepID=A0ABP1QI98_9HEXA
MQFLVFDAAYQFPKLEDLDMRISMGDLTRLKEACPRLRKLRSNLMEGTTVDRVPKNLETVFRALEQWKETLKEVELLNAVDFGNCSPSYRVDLPNLKVLTIRSCPYASYEQVPAFQNLKPLVFENWVKHVEIYRKMEVEFTETLIRVVEGNANVMDLFFQ